MSSSESSGLASGLRGGRLAATAAPSFSDKWLVAAAMTSARASSVKPEGDAGTEETWKKVQGEVQKKMKCEDMANLTFLNDASAY